MNIQRICAIFVLTLFLLPVIVSAETLKIPDQEAKKSTSSEVAMNALLLEQIKLLQVQIAAMQSELKATRREIVEIREELRLTKNLRTGMQDAEVKKLQEYLAKDPAIYPEGATTGYFGPKTEAAVKRFQEKQGLTPVGVVGPKTREKLIELTNTSEKKIAVCHVAEAGLPKRGIEIGLPALSAHLAHGDTMGSCPTGNLLSITPPFATSTPDVIPPLVSDTGRKWENIVPKPASIPTGKFIAQYFNDTNMSVVLKSEEVDYPSIQYSWSNFLQIPSENFAATWAGYVEYPAATVLRLEVAQQHAVTRVYINNALVANYTGQGTKELTVPAGKSLVQIEHENNWHTSEVNVRLAPIEKLYSATVGTELKVALAPYTAEASAILASPYESSDQYNNIAAQVTSSASPTVLVLDSYSAVVWKPLGLTEANTKAIVVSSFLPGSYVVGVPSSIPIFRLAPYGLYSQIHDGNGTIDPAKAASIISQLLGIPLKGYTSTYSAKEMTVPAVTIY